MPGFMDSSFESSSKSTSTHELTSVAKFVALMETSGIQGPIHFQRARLKNETFYEEFAPHGAQFGVYREIQNTRDGVIMKRALAPEENDARNPQLQKQLRMIELEIRALCNPNIREHCSIVKLMAWGFDYPVQSPEVPTPVLFLEEAKDTLSKFLKSPPEAEVSRIDYQIGYSWCLDIASGLQRLFECGIVHGDLKPDNVLMFYEQGRWRAKISDFGLSISTRHGDPLTYSKYKSTPGWKPPEVVQSPTASSDELPDLALFKCDSYSFGLLALAILVFEGKSLIMRNGEVEYRQQAHIIEIVERAIAASTGIPTPEESLLKPICLRICRNFLSPEPQNRAVVSLSNMAIEGDEVWKDCETLFGVALSLTVHKTQNPDYRDKVRQYVEAAARHESPSLLAQGVVAQICSAISTLDDKEELGVWKSALMDAAASGSWVAATKLKDYDPKIATEAKARHKANGGYNEERDPLCMSKAASQAVVPQTGDQVILDIGSLQVMSLEDITSTFLSQELPGAYANDDKNTILHMAAVAGRVDIIERVLQTCVIQINQKNSKGETPLYKACLSGNLDIVRLLTTQGGADASLTAGEQEISCLHWLFQFDDHDILPTMELLIRQGADVDARTKTDTRNGVREWIPFAHFPFHWPHGTPLHWASHVGSTAAADALLQAGATIDAPDCPGEVRSLTPLGIALNNADSRMVQLLCDKMADPNRADERNYRPLHILVFLEANRNFLVGRPFQRWCTHGSSTNSLREVRNCVATLHAAGAHLNDASPSFTPLIEAARTGDAAAVIALVEAGADANHSDDIYQRSPLLTWVTIDPSGIPYPETYFQALERLIKASNMVMTDSAGDSVAHLAVSNPGGREIVKRILHMILQAPQPTVNINAKNNRGETPLLVAIEIMSDGGKLALELMDLLLELGSNQQARDGKGCDFIWHLVKNRSIDDELCLKCIQNHLQHEDSAGKRQALNSSKDSKGKTALMELVDNSYEACVKYCLELGVDLAPETADGKSVLDISFYRSNQIRMDLLERFANHGIKELSDEMNDNSRWKHLIESSDINVYPSEL
ncbi:Ankyrin repeat protein [Apiospora marii]|uniref:Ankyrin repeat protein n=1 Tax=Apiospora marii TaxID=335849 RepID=A0ABR1RFE5_9PEZI